MSLKMMRSAFSSVATARTGRRICVSVSAQTAGGKKTVNGNKTVGGDKTVGASSDSKRQAEVAACKSRFVTHMMQVDMVH
jgi:hypothetical protein